ncbi:MAG: hypothetical protein ACK53V_09490, partial [Planctomycetota bacterium]
LLNQSDGNISAASLFDSLSIFRCRLKPPAVCVRSKPTGLFSDAAVTFVLPQRGWRTIVRHWRVSREARSYFVV